MKDKPPDLIEDLMALDAKLRHKGGASLQERVDLFNEIAKVILIKHGQLKKLMDCGMIKKQ